MHRVSLAATALALTIGCGEAPSEHEAVTYVGVISDSDVRIAMVHDQ